MIDLESSISMKMLPDKRSLQSAGNETHRSPLPSNLAYLV